METPLSTRQLQYVQTLRRSAESLMSVINDVLDHSKIEAGMLAVEKIGFDLRVTIEEAVRLFSGRAEEKGLRYELKIASSIPQYVMGDPARLRQIVLNFIGNAVKFTAKGGISVTADADVSSGQPPAIVITVADTGVGIRPEKQALVFEKYSQAETSTSREYGGSGLGLSICRQLAVLMGGSVGLTSRLGEGSSFWVRVPLERAAASEIARNARTENAATHGSELKFPSSTILLVEDNTTNQLLASELLAKMGCDVQIAENGLRAVEMVSARAYDVILMDCHMPEMDGFAATGAIRAQGGKRHHPIIALTANAMQGDRERCLAAGMDDYLTKPIEQDVLAQKLARWLAPQKITAAPVAVRAEAETVASRVAVPGCIDLDAALKRMGGNQKLLRKLAGSFCDAFPASHERLRAAVKKRDAKEAGIVAHTLRGTTSMFSADKAVSLLVIIEESSSGPDWSRIDPALVEFEDEMRAVIGALRQTGANAPAVTA
jgi:CheY-like chemotaxis protein